MSLIEGIGDEVLVVLAVLGVAISLVMAWVSTHVQDTRFFSETLFRYNQSGNSEQETSSVSSGADNQASDDPTHTQNEVQETGENRTATTDVRATISEGSVNSCNNPLSADAEDASAITEQITDQPITSSTSNRIDDDSSHTSSIPHEESPCPSRDERGATHEVTLGNVQQSVPLTSQELRKRRIDFLSDQLSTNDVSRQNESSDSVPLTETLASSCSLSTSSPQASQLTEGHIRLRLKDMRDNERVVQVRPEDTMAHFKRTHFAAELASNKVVRLICNGRELQREDLSIQAYNLTDNTILHCLVTQSNQQTRATPMEIEEELEIGMYMYPLFGIILCMVWYCRVVYREFFDPMATFSLIGITLLFIVVMVASWVHRDPEHLPMPQHLHVE